VTKHCKWSSLATKLFHKWRLVYVLRHHMMCLNNGHLYTFVIISVLTWILCTSVHTLHPVLVINFRSFVNSYNKWSLSFLIYSFHTFSWIVTAPPALIGETDKITVSASIGIVTSFYFKTYSTSHFNVDMDRSTLTQNNGSTANSSIRHSHHVISTRLQLPVFNTTVDTDGFHVFVYFTISTLEEFGEYQLLVTNRIGTAQLSVEIIPEGTCLL